MPAAYPERARHAQVVHELGARIVRGGLAPGDAVPTEDELVTQFHVGRSALREGVKVLAGKGLLESRTSAGTRVRPRESWNLLDPDVLTWRFAPSPSPGRHPGAGRSPGSARTGRGAAGRRVGHHGAAQRGRGRDGAPLGDRRRSGRVHRGGPRLPPCGVRRGKQRPAALRPRRHQRRADRDQAAAHPLDWPQPRDTARSRARGPRHQARSPPQGRGGDARGRRGGQGRRPPGDL